MFKRMRAVVIFIVVIVAAVAVINGLLPRLLGGPGAAKLPPGGIPSGTPGAEAALPVPVRTFKAAKIEFTDLLPTLGTVRGQAEVDLKFEASGVVKTLSFREGDLVKEGQPLATLDDRESRLRVEYAETKLQTAEAQLRLAEKRLAINEQLYRLGAIIKPKWEESQIEVEQAEGQVATAQKEVDLARTELAKTVLKAPVDGVMGTREAEIGEYVTPQATVATLMDVDSVFVELGIVERDIERIRLQQRVKVTVDSLPNTTFEGRIDNLAPVIEGKSRTLTAKVKVENPKGQLLPGMFARAEIAVFEKPGALVVPTSALRDADGDGKFESVFIVHEDKAAMKPITLGYLTTDYAEITDGLQEGEPVVTEARGNLKEGSQVSLLEEEEAAFERAEPSFPGGKKE